jgi:hypothetical protein
MGNQESTRGERREMTVGVIVSSFDGDYEIDNEFARPPFLDAVYSVLTAVLAQGSARLS